MRNGERETQKMCSQIDRICIHLEKSGLILSRNCHHTKHFKNCNTIRVWWRDLENANNDNCFNDKVTVWEYKYALDNNDYSFLLNDGSVVQLFVEYEGNTITSYRYAYLPCPVSLIRYPFIADDAKRIDDFEEASTGDAFSEGIDQFEEHDVAALIETAASCMCETEPRENFFLAAPLRFEWNSKSCPKHEPKSHVHLGKSECRIALSHPISIWDFIDFIFRNFYSDKYDKFRRCFRFNRRSIAKAVSKDMNRGECIRDCEKAHIHFLVPNLR